MYLYLYNPFALCIERHGKGMMHPNSTLQVGSVEFDTIVASKSSY